MDIVRLSYIDVTPYRKKKEKKENAVDRWKSEQ